MNSKMNKEPRLSTLSLIVLRKAVKDRTLSESTRRKARYKLQVLKESNYRCQNCKKAGDLTIEHLDGRTKQCNTPSEFNPKKHRMIILCERCHMYKNKWIK